jgi:predicted nucleic acid-binding protein
MKKMVFDTNVIIDFLKEKIDAIDLSLLMGQYLCYISVITKLELLKYPNISAEEESKIRSFLAKITVLPITKSIETATITISRASSLKLPDAIIGATAIALDAELLTRDPHFLKCHYPALRVMAEFLQRD